MNFAQKLRKKNFRSLRSRRFTQCGLAYPNCWCIGTTYLILKIFLLMPGTTTFFQNVSRKYSLVRGRSVRQGSQPARDLIGQMPKEKEACERKKSSVPCACGARLQPTLPMTSLAVKICNFERNFLKCCVPWLRQKLSFQQNLEVKFTVTVDNYQRQCRFMATFSEMLRTVASPWVPRPPFLFVNILRSLRVPGANINTVPNSAVG